MEVFNDYKNKATWIIANWFKRDEELYSSWRKRAEELTRTELLKELRLYFEDIEHPLKGKLSVYTELLNYSLALIDWDEVVDILKEEER